jgi:hypothetical protein
VNFEDTVALDEFEARYGPGDGLGEEDAGAMIGPKGRPKRRNARLLTLGAASWEWLHREGALSDM